MKIFKWILICLAALCAAAAAALIIFVNSYDFNNLKPEISSLVKTETGRDLTIAGDVELSLSLTPSLLVEDVSFQNAPWGSRPNMISVKRMACEVGLLSLLFGEVEINELVLIEPDILIETDASGRSNLDMGGAAEQGPLKQKHGKPDNAHKTEDKKSKEGIREEQRHLVLGDVRVENGSLLVKDGQSMQSFDLKLKSFTARTENLNSTLRLSIKGSYNQEPFTLEGSSGSLASSLDREVAWPLKLSGKFAGVRMVLDGLIQDLPNRSGLDLKFNMASEEIERLLSLDGKKPWMRGPARVQAHLSDPERNAWRLDDLKLSFGGNDLSGWVFIKNDEKRILKGELNSRRFDVRTLLPGDGAKDTKDKDSGSADRIKGTGAPGREPENGGQEKLFRIDPLHFAKLRDEQIDLKLAVGHLLLPGISANKVDLALKLDNGVLRIEPLKAVLGGGELDARLNLTEADDSGRIELEMKLQGMNLQTCLRELGEKGDYFGGILGLEAQLSSQGKSMAQIMAGLSGKAVINLKEAELNNKYIGQAGGQAMAGLLERLNPLRKTSKYSKVSCFVNRLDIEEGLATIKVLFMETDLMALQGGGEIDLVRERLDIVFDPKAKQGARTMGTNQNLDRLVKPFKITGSLSRPAVSQDVSPVMLTISKTAASLGLFGPEGLATTIVSKNDNTKDACARALHLARHGELPEAPESPKGKK